MPRKPRFNLIGVPQHVIQRGNNREPCFFSEADYYRYLDENPGQRTIVSENPGQRTIVSNID